MMKLFPDNWKLDEANMLCSSIIDCINKTAPVVDYDTPFKMIRTTNVKNGRINLDDARCVDEATFNKWNRRLTPQKDDIVLTREAPLGDVGLIRTDDKVFLGQRTMLYRANPAILDQRFLYYTLLGPTLQAQLKTLGSGSTVEHVRVPDAEKLTIPYPCLTTQRKIAAILSAYDDLIENNNSRIRSLEKMTEEIYREWFIRLRFPSDKGGKVKKLNPKKWEKIKLPNLAKITYGFPFKAEKFNSHGMGKPIVRIRNIQNSETQDYTEETVSEKYLVKQGDILIGMDGEFHINHWYGEEAYLVQRVCKISPLQSILKGYLYRAIQRPIKHLESILLGATVGHLGAKHLNDIDILIPPVEHLVHLDIFNKLENQKAQIEYINRQLTKTKNLLLSRLISGKLSVEKLNIQLPPSMLERSCN